MRALLALLLLSALACGDDDGSSTFDAGAGDGGALDGGAGEDAGCAEPRQLGDLANPDDLCWAPPSIWCSGGAGLSFTTACAPDGSRCCERPDTCIPCGWVDCTGGDAACPADAEALPGLVADGAAECDAITAAPFCP